MQDKTFHFQSYHFDEDAALLKLFYGFEDGDEFEEIIQFPKIERSLNDNDRQVIDRACRLVFLLAGVSYYKAYPSIHLICDAFDLDQTTALFVENIYRQGLGEFAFENDLDLRKKIKFIYSGTPAPNPINMDLSEFLCVPVGGGKDSVVTVEALKKSDIPMTLFVMSSPAGIAKPIQKCIEKSGLPYAQIMRTISPNIMALNAQGAYNGHVPITAILSALATAMCLMQGWSTLVLSNEHSASAANVHHNGQKINHQYSKSFEFEKSLSDYIKNYITPSFSYFSFLRPLSEINIAQKFAQYTHYHDVFQSCNRAFKIREENRGNWCCDCPKCRFVFLALAPFVDKQSMINIFGKNMLDDDMQLEGFLQLCGLSAFKPFECVGEIKESVLLLQKLRTMTAWKDDKIVTSLSAKIPFKDNFESSWAEMFKFQGAHFIPDQFIGLLDDN